jgi:hypothetical protein
VDTFRCRHPKVPENTRDNRTTGGLQCKLCQRVRDINRQGDKVMQRVNAGLPADGRRAPWLHAL